MLQVLVGLFTSNRDREDALQALQALGLSPENGHLYQENRHDPGPPLRSESSPLELLSERAEHAAHGEYLDVSGAANHSAQKRTAPHPALTEEARQVVVPSCRRCVEQCSSVAARRGRNPFVPVASC
jgi:hypothetical protein